MTRLAVGGPPGYRAAWVLNCPGKDASHCIALPFDGMPSASNSVEEKSCGIVMLRSAKAPTSSSPSSESGPKLNMPLLSGIKLTPGDRTGWSEKTWLGSMWPNELLVAKADVGSAPEVVGNMGLPLDGLYMNWFGIELAMFVGAGRNACGRW